MSWYDTRLDEARRKAGLLTVEQVVALADRDVTVFDPFSTLVGERVELGEGCVLYPGTVLECDAQSVCVLGRDNVLSPGTRICAVQGGHVQIGHCNNIGEGGAQVKANRPDARIEIGGNTRVSGGAELVGSTVLGSGCQVIGAISAQSVILEGGGDWTHPEPDERGAVLKGFGLARGLRLRTGDVVNGAGDFRTAPVERQSHYHPKATAR